MSVVRRFAPISFDFCAVQGASQPSFIFSMLRFFIGSGLICTIRFLLYCWRGDHQSAPMSEALLWITRLDFLQEYGSSNFECRGSETTLNPPIF